MIRRPPRSTLSSSSAASDVYKRQLEDHTNRREHLAQPSAAGRALGDWVVGERLHRLQPLGTSGAHVLVGRHDDSSSSGPPGRPSGWHSRYATANGAPGTGLPSTRRTPG